jgi:hypothetical protein
VNVGSNIPPVDEVAISAIPDLAYFTGLGNFAEIRIVARVKRTIAECAVLVPEMGRMIRAESPGACQLSLDLLIDLTPDRPHFIPWIYPPSLMSERHIILY